MEAEMFYKSYEAMNILKARETLTSVDVASYTKISDKDRANYHRELHKQANPLHFENWVSSKDAVEILKQRGRR